MAENYWYANLRKEVEELIRNVPDFPKEGIQFKDITPLFKNASVFEKLMSYYTSSLAKKTGVCSLQSKDSGNEPIFTYIYEIRAEHQKLFVCRFTQQLDNLHFP